MRFVMAIFLMLLAGVASVPCAAQPPNNVIAQYASPIVDIYGSINYDDGMKVVYVATADGNVHEIFYRNAGYGTVPADHGDSVIGHIDSSIVAIAGFYAEDDHNRIVEVATADGNIHEIFYHPTNGRGESIIYNQPGIVGLAAFYNRDDHFRDVLVAASDGSVRELYYYPQMHADLLRQYSGIVDIAGYYDRSNDNRVSVVLTNDGKVHTLVFHDGQHEYTDAAPSLRVTSIAANVWKTVFGSSDGTIEVWLGKYSGTTSSQGDAAPGIVRVGIGEDEDSDVIYATKDGAIHVFVPPPVVAPPPPPTIKIFAASPHNGYVNIGQTATLSWQVDQCSAPCNISLVGHDGFNFNHVQTPQKSGLPNPGSLTVTTTDTQTRFVLTALGSNGGPVTSQPVDVVLAPNPDPCPTCTWFYFKLTNPKSESRPCFVQAVWAPSEGAGEQLVSDPGYTVTGIDYDSFLSGCQ